MDVSNYKELFYKTASANMAGLRQAMESIQKGAGNASLFNQMYINAHSLKGEALVMGFKQFGSFSLVVEQFLKRMKDGDQVISEQEVVLLSSAIGRLEAALQEIKKQGHEPNLDFETDMLAKQLAVKLENEDTVS